MQPAPAESANRLVTTYGKLPLSFEANQGQTDQTVKFLSRGRGYALFLTGNEAVLSFTTPSAVTNPLSANRQSRFESGNPWATSLQLPGLAGQPQRTTSAGTHAAKSSIPVLIENPQLQTANSLSLRSPKPEPRVVRLRLVGANAHAAVAGADELPGKVNYLIGNDSKKWRTNVPTYAKVRYRNVYPGVDLVYTATKRGDWNMTSWSRRVRDPQAIVLAVGARRDAPQQIDGNGDLLVPTEGGELRFHKPVVYQPGSGRRSLIGIQQMQSAAHGLRTMDSGLRTAVEGHYVFTASNQVRFAIGPYDRSRPLVIDPTLAFSTYLGGGSDGDYGYSIAVDSGGNAYVTGFTGSTNFPTINPLQASYAGGQDAFVTKLNPAGSALIYSTYLGGSNYERANAIAVDTSGNAYVTGFTESTNFPTLNPFQATLVGTFNAFVTKLNATGSALVYSTYLGGSNDDQANAIAVDSSGNAYVTGYTYFDRFSHRQPASGKPGRRQGRVHHQAEPGGLGPGLLYLSGRQQ